MKKLSFVVGSAFVLAFGLGVYGEQTPQRAPVTNRGSAGAPAAAAQTSPASAPKTQSPVASHAATSAVESESALVKQYCATCHNDRNKNNAGGLSLQGFDASKVGHDEAVADVAEKMIRKLRSGMMPPAGSRRPEAAVIDAFATSMETRLDQAAVLNPNPGYRPFQRLNRAEYARAVHQLLALDVDVSAFLPPDQISAGFDNVADSQTFSATLMEGYLRAANRISSLAVGDPKAAPSATTYKVPRTASQMHHIDGTPFGTRGGMAVMHTFPADGEYSFRMQLHSIPTGQLFGSTVKGELLEVSIDGERAAVLEINPRMSEADANEIGRAHV